MIYYAVLDTNVLVSSLLTKNADSATAQMLNLIAEGTIIPVYNPDILREYREVLHRPKFSFSPFRIRQLLSVIQQFGDLIDPIPSEEAFLPDASDRVFYEVTLAKREEGDAYLITGNLRHFPVRPFVVTPAEMLGIVHSDR